MKKLISITEAAALIGLGRDKMYALVKSDPNLPIIRIGSVTKVNVQLLDQYLADKCKDGELI